MFASRPMTATGMSSLRFDTSGTMARPAGTAGLFASSGMGGAGGSFAYGQSLSKSTGLAKHALQLASPYAEITPTGWTAREPLVQPTSNDTGAGVVSAGSIDNTYTPQPLKNAWGKARELARNEIRSYPRKQATDLLIMAKGGNCPPPAMATVDMESMRPAYSKTIPLFHSIDPQRLDSGFVRSPNIIPGAGPPPLAPYNRTTFQPRTVPVDHALRKLSHDQGMKGGRLPVQRIVHAEPQRPTTAQPRFQSMSAGLPGGLSLLKK